MGLKPSDYAMLTGMVGGPLLGAAFGRDPAELQSFEGTWDNGPTYLLQHNKELLDSIMPMIMGRANAGVSLPSAYVQQPGSYSGGGLPMPIGLVASDPALSNPNLLKLPGVSSSMPASEGKGWTPGDGSILRWGQPQDDSTPDNPDYVDPGGYHGGKPPSGQPPRTAQPRSGPMRRSAAPLFSEGDLIDPGDDLQQALGSVQLLLDAYGSR